MFSTVAISINQSINQSRMQQLTSHMSV